MSIWEQVPAVCSQLQERPPIRATATPSAITLPRRSTKVLLEAAHFALGRTCIYDHDPGGLEMHWMSAPLDPSVRLIRFSATYIMRCRGAMRIYVQALGFSTRVKCMVY